MKANERLLTISRFVSHAWCISVRELRQTTNSATSAQHTSDMNTHPPSPTRPLKFRQWITVAIACMGFASTLNVAAHSLSDSYIELEIADNSIVGQWEIALTDLQDLVGLDTNGDNNVTRGELDQSRERISKHVFEKFRLQADGKPVVFTLIELRAEKHEGDMFAVLKIKAKLSEAPSKLHIKYDLLFDIDPIHRGMLELRQGNVVHSATFSPTKSVRVFDVGSASASAGNQTETAKHGSP